MKKTTLLLFLVLGLTSTERLMAQMATAGTLTWDVEIQADVKASKGDVWIFLNDNKKLKQYSNGYVKSIKKVDKALIVTREVILSNGRKRKEAITQTNHEYKFMVIKFSKESLPKGIKNVTIGIFTEDKDQGNITNIKWLARVSGKKAAKKALIKQLKSEFESYARGFSNIGS